MTEQRGDSPRSHVKAGGSETGADFNLRLAMSLAGLLGAHLHLEPCLFFRWTTSFRM